MKKNKPLTQKFFRVIHMFLFGFGIFSSAKAQSPYCDPAMTGQSGNCTTYNMSINAVQITQGSTTLYSRAHGTFGYNGCNAATGQYFLISSSSLFTLKAGGSYTFGFTTGNSYPVGVGVWIDLNRDNDFADAGEWLSNGWCTPYLTAGSSILQNFTLKVPAAITQGVTRLRIRSNYSACTANDNGCTTYNYGEAEDYTITLASDPNDAGITAISPPLCNPSLTATLTNLGNNDINPVKIGWSVNGAYQKDTAYKTTIKIGISVTLGLLPNYNFIDGNTYTVKVFTYEPNNVTDPDKKNDTTKLTFKYVGPAQTPTVTDIIKCGPGQVPLKAIPGNAADSIVWYNVATGGSIIAKGKNIVTPPLVLGVNTYYAQAFKISSPTSFANAMTPSVGYGSTYSGGFADITPKLGLVIDSFAVVLSSNVTTATFNVYMRNGTYVGYHTTPSAWVKIASNVGCRTRLVGSYYRAYIKIPETLLSQGVTYGFYITTTSPSTIPYSNAAGAITISNGDMSVYQAQITYGASEFLTGLANYNLTWETFYRTANCGSSRAPLVVTVKPSPNGAAFIKGSLFQTTQPNTTGSKGSPDIVAKGDMLTYEITPPTGYTNSGYGTTWIMKNFTIRTPKGWALPTSYYSPSSPTPSGSTNAKFNFKPDASIVDSTFIMTVSIEDLGPHYCDSTLTRYIFVAPRPVADFKFQQPVCDGDNVIFNNVSSISTGNIMSKWDFGTGNPADTSDNTDVVFTFPTHGTYDVKLITTSVPYGYTDNITIPVTVTEIPKIGFKVFNACLGDSVSFVNSSTISKGAIAYKWNFGNGSSSTKANPKQKYPVAGSYKVTLTATSNGCSQTLTKNAWEFARPVAKFTAPQTLCDKTDIQLTNGSTIAMGNMGYKWSFSDGGVSTFANPTHNFSTPGAKSVKMKAISEFGCADSVTKSITLSEAPLADFTFGPVCNLSNTQFNFMGTKPGAGVITIFNWDFGNEGSTAVESPSKLLSIIGKKLVTLTLTSNNGCSDKIVKEVNVKLQSKADFTASDICEGENAVFTNNSSVSSGNLNYFWKFGDGTNSSAQAPRHLYPGSSKTYNVTLVAIVQGGCSDSITKAVSVNATPVSTFTYTTAGRLVNFKATQAGATSYHWDFGDGGTAEVANSQYHYLNYPAGNYRVCLSVVNAAECFSQSCQQVAITGGINQLNKLSGVKVYPNPNKGNFTVSVEDPKSDISIVVYNLLGDVVKTIETNPLKSVYSIDLNTANGVYMVKVNNGGLTSTQKLTVSK